jgi:hypothetical protein
VPCSGSFESRKFTQSIHLFCIWEDCHHWGVQGASDFRPTGVSRLGVNEHQLFEILTIDIASSSSSGHVQWRARQSHNCLVEVSSAIVIVEVVNFMVLVSTLPLIVTASFRSVAKLERERGGCTSLVLFFSRQRYNYALMQDFFFANKKKHKN